VRALLRFARGRSCAAVADPDLVPLAVSTARTELAAEVEHSKSLQHKLKNVPASASLSSSTAAPAASSGPGSALAKLQEEHDRLTTHLNLNEDLTGFAVHSVKQDDDGATYTCVLSDCAGTTGCASRSLALSSLPRGERR